MNSQPAAKEATQLAIVTQYDINFNARRRGLSATTIATTPDGYRWVELMRELPDARYGRALVQWRDSEELKFQVDVALFRRDVAHEPASLLAGDGIGEYSDLVLAFNGLYARIDNLLAAQDAVVAHEKEKIQSEVHGVSADDLETVKAVGFEVQQGTEADGTDLVGLWWWTLNQPAWNQPECSNANFTSEADAWANAVQSFKNDRELLRKLTEVDPEIAESIIANVLAQAAKDLHVLSHATETVSQTASHLGYELTDAQIEALTPRVLARYKSGAPADTGKGGDGVSRAIKLDAFDIVVTLLPEGGANITSSLHESGETEAVKRAIFGVEMMIMTHAEAGLDINAPAYLHGIKESVEVILAHSGPA